MGTGKPHSAQSPSPRISDRRIKDTDVVVDFIPAMPYLVAKTHIDSQVRTYLVVVLNEHLWTLQPRTVLRRNLCAPGLRLAKQEVCVVQASRGVRRSRSGRGIY